MNGTWEKGLIETGGHGNLVRSPLILPYLFFFPPAKFILEFTSDLPFHPVQS